MKKCPHCAELIKPDAKVCRYCGRDAWQLTSNPSFQQDASGAVNSNVRPWKNISRHTTEQITLRVLSDDKTSPVSHYPYTPFRLRPVAKRIRTSEQARFRERRSLRPRAELGHQVRRQSAHSRNQSAYAGKRTARSQTSFGPLEQHPVIPKWQPSLLLAS